MGKLYFEVLPLEFRQSNLIKTFHLSARVEPFGMFYVIKKTPIGYTDKPAFQVHVETSSISKKTYLNSISECEQWAHNDLQERLNKLVSSVRNFD